MTRPRTLYEKIWDAHVVEQRPDGTCLIFIDRHLVHEVTSPQAFAGLRASGRTVRRPDLTLAVPDHNLPTTARRDADGNRQRAHYDGLPVEFVAESISTLGAKVAAGESDSTFETYHVMNPYDDGIGMDEYVDWLIEAGYPITRVPEYADWLARFETGLRALPDRQRGASLLPLLHNYQQPSFPVRGSIAPVPRFRAAVQDAKIGVDKDIPNIESPVIVKYITDLQLLGLL